MFMTEKQIEKKLAWLDEEYSVRKYRRGTLIDREYDFYNLFKDKSEAFFKIFGREKRKNEHPKVSEEREFLILGLYENRKDKSVIDMDLERRQKEFFKSPDTDGDVVNRLDNTLCKLNSLQTP